MYLMARAYHNPILFPPRWTTFHKIQSHVKLTNFYIPDEDNSDKTTCHKWKMVILSHCEKYTNWYTQHNGTELLERKLTFLSF